MTLRRTILWMLTCLVLVIAAGCGGGSDTVSPIGEPPLDTGQGGDIPDPTIPGQPLNPFLPPGGAYVDIRGIASSREFVYIADQTVLYCFDKRGNLRNGVAAPDTIQGVAVFPATVDGKTATPWITSGAPTALRRLPRLSKQYRTVWSAM